MLNTISFHKTTEIAHLREKAGKLLAAISDIKKGYKSFFMKCAVIYMSVKIGIILLATFSMTALIISYVSPHLAMEMSRPKAIIVVSPLTLVVIFKIYFIFSMLMRYERSRLLIRSFINVVLLKGIHGAHRIKETLPAGLSPLSLENARNS